MRENIVKALYGPIERVLLLATIVSATAIRAQPPAAVTSQLTTPSIPRTPAGDALRTWLDAFNSGDTALLGAYYRRYQPQFTSDEDTDFRQQTGGFDLLTIERSEPRHLEFTVRERHSPTTAYGVIDLSAADPVRVKTRRLLAMGQNATAAALRVDAASRAHAIAGVAALLDTFYVFPDVAKRMGDSLRARLARKTYDSYSNGMMFAMRINDDL
ncbi:MAG: retinol-binding protein 3, partial [Gemmatimonadaceae bacterium]|nr:retinol-binding protein 3 [Gemmatimonadaceae bacterium]